jgi:cellulose synthase operon protein C
VSSNQSTLTPELPAKPPSPAAASATIPLAARLTHEIPKPKDWQAFQRNCTLLFQAELSDPNAQEYGRSGQKQGGIDILGRRNGSPDHYVGVQCRHIEKPLKKADILKECRAALALKAELKEIIFATTAPDDTVATDAALAVERELRSEGYKLGVIVYGWDALQSKIAVHDVAYAAFCPSIVASSTPEAATLFPAADLSAQVAAHVVEHLRQTGVVIVPREAGAVGGNDEDPALHARIDTYRDLFRDQKQPRLAEKELLVLLSKERLEGKPWARFRIETNLGAIAFALGRETEGAARFEAAYALRPADPNAVANLALARTIQRRYDEAMSLAQEALAATPRPTHAVGYLLQAAALSNWQGDPETLIPLDIVGSEHADFGLTEFLRRRNIPGWAERSLGLSRRHPGGELLKRVGAIAVLALATESGAFIPGGRGPVTLEDVNRAADDMKAHTDHCLDIGFADENDLAAFLNNTAMLLRLSDRHAECEALLQRGLPKVSNQPSLRRLLALAQVENGHRPEALATLAAAGDDPESHLLSVELIAANDPAGAIARALTINPATLDKRLGQLRWHLVGDLALKIGDTESLKAAVAGVRALDTSDIMADILEIRGDKRAGLNEDKVQQRVRAAAAALPPDVDMVTRYLVANELRSLDLPQDASTLLEGHVDLSRRSPATMLYLQSLAAARRDDAFHKAIAAAASGVRDDPESLWTIAAHSWNIGDLKRAFRAVETLLVQQPDNLRARLLKIEILIRQNRSSELVVELDKPIENLAWTRLQDQFRIASLLGYFGYTERAAAYAYKLFLKHRDNSLAWMALSMLVLEEGRGEANRSRHFEAPLVAPNVAVDLRYDDGEQVLFVIEPDADLRKLDVQSWEPDHPLIQALTGLAVGARFTAPTGRKGVIAQLRHKYVARLHYVLEHHETRFPTVQGFRKVPVDFEKPGGLDEMIAELKARHDWYEREQEQYRSGPWPLGVLAYRLGLDVIDAAASLTSKGIPLKVAMGAESEREEAARAVRKNSQKGCVLDLQTFWTAWRLQALDTVAATCGPIHVAQNVMDRLRFRREQFNYSAEDGLRSAGYEAGKISLQEITPEVVAHWRDDADRAIAWAEVNAVICPLVAKEDLPAALREHLREERSDIFDSIVLAMQNEVLLVTDDMPIRGFSRLVGGGSGTWLQQVFAVALDKRQIDLDTYIRWLARLLELGQNYVGISGNALVRALRLDSEAGGAPGYLFTNLTKVIGGRSAEPRSHLFACIFCLRDLWSDDSAMAYRQPATALLLRQLLRERFDDYDKILRTLLGLVRGLPVLVVYIDGWARGHFLRTRQNQA